MMKVKLILSLDQLEKAYKEYKKSLSFFWVILWYSSRNNGR